MNKPQLIASAKRHGYILIYPEYSRKSRQRLWVAKVPTTEIKQSPGLIRSRKILENSDLEKLKDKVEEYLGEDRDKVKIVVREHKHAHEIDISHFM